MAPFVDHRHVRRLYAVAQIQKVGDAVDQFRCSQLLGGIRRGLEVLRMTDLHLVGRVVLVQQPVSKRPCGCPRLRMTGKYLHEIRAQLPTNIGAIHTHYARRIGRMDRANGAPVSLQLREGAHRGLGFFGDGDRVKLDDVLGTRRNRMKVAR